MHTSINITIHNKEFLLNEMLFRIYEYTTGTYEIVFVLDGCQDKSEEILLDNIRKYSARKIKTSVIYADNVFESKANNLAAKKSTGEYIIIVQDDMLINEFGWNERLLLPFKKFDDVFGITANCAHNWIVDKNSHDHLITDNTYLNHRWATTLKHIDHANKDTIIDRNCFAIRQCVNRGPLALNHQDFAKLNYFDDSYKQDLDEHDLCFRMRDKIQKEVGFFHVDWFTEPRFGGTRDEEGKTKQWVFEGYHKNSIKMIHEHCNPNTGDFDKKIENRIIK